MGDDDPCLIDLFEQRLMSGKLPSYLGEASAIVDPPEKVGGDTHVSDLLLGQLAGLGLAAKNEMLVISPYFVPGKLGMDWFAYLRAHGARVRVLTNSMAASDVPVVHAGYARYRKDLLDMGVELHELKPLPNSSPKKTRIVGSGSSRSSLHTKSFVLDRERVFIGSFNFDPRSALLNTELGLMIKSPAAAGKVAEMAEQVMAPAYSHRLSLKNEHGQSGILWSSRTDKNEVVTDTEPNTTGWERFKLELLMLLPLEGHL
jgi:putative cardiolipin synthase